MTQLLRTQARNGVIIFPYVTTSGSLHKCYDYEAIFKSHTSLAYYFLTHLDILQVKFQLDMDLL